MPHPETPQEYRRRRAYVAALAAVEPTETALDRVCNFAAERPWVICLIVVSSILISCAIDLPH